MAQYEKLINLSLLNQFLTKAKTIFAPKITASGILKGDGNGNVSAATAGTDYATPVLVAAVKPIMLLQSIAIPAGGVTVAYDVTGMTENHRLAQWNFADNGTALAENSPPCSLKWATYDGYFTITNNGGTTTATMQPLFLIPAFLPATTHTS